MWKYSKGIIITGIFSILLIIGAYFFQKKLSQKNQTTKYDTIKTNDSTLIIRPKKFDTIKINDSTLVIKPKK